VTSSPRSFVLRHTHVRPVPGLEEVRLHLADEVLPLWHAVQVETDDPDAALPYWAFAWGGVCAIAAMRAGASAAAGADIDPFAAAAITLNARANGHRVTAVCRDVLDDDPPDADVILAGDCWYEARLAERVLPWLEGARARGIDVLVGDPGRRFLPSDALVELAAYDVRTTTVLEDLDRRTGWVYALRATGDRA